MDVGLFAAEGRLTEILEREIALYERFVPDKRILAEYLFNTKMRLLEMIENAFDAKIQDLLDAAEIDEILH